MDKERNKDTKEQTNTGVNEFVVYVFVFICVCLFANCGFLLFSVVCCAVCRQALHAGRVLLALVAFEWEVWRVSQRESVWTAGQQASSFSNAEALQQLRAVQRTMETMGRFETLSSASLCVFCALTVNCM